MRSSLTVLALSSLAACTSPADEFRNVLPDDRLVIDDAGFSMLARGAGEPSDYATTTHDVIADLNGGIEDVLGLVDLITSFPASWSGAEDKALWGPWEADGTSGQLWVHGTKAEGYTWAIEIRPTHDKGGDWTPVLAGEVDAGATEEASTGRFAIDFTAIASAEAGDGVLGALTTDYALRDDGAEATIALGEFSDDGSVPADGAAHYDHTKGQGGLMDLVLEADLDDPNGILETVIVRSRWIDDGRGRADAYLTGGDLGELTYTETDCWDGTQTTVFFENNFELITSGDPSLCVFADAQYPPEE